MPTAYTAPVEDGTITTLADYAGRCARAFGALISLREEPLSSSLDVTIAYSASDYYPRSLADDQAEMARLTALSPADIDAENEADYHRRVAACEKSLAVFNERAARYAAMRAKIEAWNVAAEYHGLRGFMLSQLIESTRYDSPPRMPARTDAAAAHAESLAYLARRIANTEEHIRKEAEGMGSSQAWIDGLRAAVKGL